MRSAFVRRTDKQHAELIAHEGTADLAGLAGAVEGWLRDKGLDTDTITGDKTCVVKAEALAGWKKAIGASPSVEVEISDEPAGTKVEIHPGRAAAPSGPPATSRTRGWRSASPT